LPQAVLIMAVEEMVKESFKRQASNFNA